MKEVSPESGLTGPDDVESTIPDSEALQVTMITLMRIYDLLGALLNEQNPELAEAYAATHAEGRLIGPLPVLNLGGPDEPQ